MTEITSGSATFRVIDTRKKAWANENFPIGRIIMWGTDDTSGLPFSDIITWTEVGQGLVPQGCASGAGKTVAAGLPNITGHITMHGGEKPSIFNGMTGAFKSDTHYDNFYRTAADLTERSASVGSDSSFGFDASRSNSIYGNSSTVQPPALLVHFFQRTA